MKYMEEQLKVRSGTTRGGKSMKQYVKLQIIKHALQHYVQRENALDKDIKQEKKVLDDITQDVEKLKENYNIK
jgi:hypothetical protein